MMLVMYIWTSIAYGFSFDKTAISFLILFLFLVYMVPLFKRKDLRNYRLTDYFRLGTLIYFITDLSYLFYSSSTHVFTFSDGYVSSVRTVTTAVLVILCGGVGLLLGDILVPLNNKLSLNRFKEFEPNRLFLIIMIVLPPIQLLLLLSGAYGYGTGINESKSIAGVFSRISLSLTSLGIVAYSIRYTENNRISLALVYLVVSEVTIGSFTGMKEFVIVPLILVLLAIRYGGKRINRIFLLIGGLFAAILYPLTNIYRGLLLASPSSDSKWSVFVDSLFQIGSENFFKILTLSTQSYGERLSLFSYLCRAVDNLDNWGFYHAMDRYIYLPIAWVLPRLIVPSKPTSMNGEEFYYLLTGFRGNSVSVTSYGWSFLEGGLLYVLIVFTIFAIVLNFVEKITKFFGQKGVIMFVAMIPILIKIETDPYFLMVGLLQILLVYSIFLFVINLYGKSRST